ncbi:LysM peptidoglycan-binding domain-containing protein [Bacillus sp. Marseille-Q3570]|uniref:LysM peptidoglycan-binding domain-containing protein n=1 Tax=Bacillus sp. Marseille-Q3570 TaxID=2963522 RepID=UPI0021B84291|nr:LysM peptidoglycan-binding domain-containing protein [Bacillus sp. Marseille-Q3570]
MKKVLPGALAAGFVMTVGTEAYAHSGEEVIESAKKFLGTPYKYGSAVGNTSSFDCSSFTATVFRQHGVKLPRTSRAQAKVGKSVRSGDLQPGDLVFFDTNFNGTINHVAIYAGNGKMIGAQSKGVGYANPFSPYYWSDRYVKARRVLPDSGNVENTPTLTVVKGSKDPEKTKEVQVTVKSIRFHTVRKGDTLWEISRRYKTDVQTLKKLNDIKSHWIYPGQTIQLPTKEKSRDVVVRSYSMYNIQKGDTLWDIGQKYGVTVEKLMKVNKLSSSLIYPGQPLMISK